ncbi:DJ-1/PfpI family protein [Caballeronia sp. LZ043]|uniref:DJ-1/PfpI family protein n=1 Tax=Caballeronia sp. LZ043 TaxID=3038569 RepID=UPI0028595A33|nr:DJ-1/PfpI family protein [Caballeronia sp. LZ043]MDR5822428.1 DJ-1/PfpI family protein [Caballeronia sp. LZ043]
MNELSSTLRRQRKAGTIVAACCTANYLLAEAGLLDGRAATTHWARASDFARRYPPVEVRARELLIEQDGIISGDSVTSYLNLAVRLVETCAGERLATTTAKALLIDMNRTSQRLLPPLSTTWADRQARPTAQQQMEATLQQGFRLSDLAAALVEANARSTVVPRKPSGSHARASAESAHRGREALAGNAANWTHRHVSSTFRSARTRRSPRASAGTGAGRSDRCLLPKRQIA